MKPTEDEDKSAVRLSDSRRESGGEPGGSPASVSDRKHP